MMKNPSDHSGEGFDDSHRKARMQVESLEPRILMSAAMFDVIDDTSLVESTSSSNESSAYRGAASNVFDDLEIADLDLDILLPYMAAGLAAEIQCKRKMEEMELSDLPNELASPRPSY